MRACVRALKNCTVTQRKGLNRVRRIAPPGAIYSALIYKPHELKFPEMRRVGRGLTEAFSYKILIISFLLHPLLLFSECIGDDRRLDEEFPCCPSSAHPTLSTHPAARSQTGGVRGQPWVPPPTPPKPDCRHLLHTGAACVTHLGGGRGVGAGGGPVEASMMKTPLC